MMSDLVGLLVMNVSITIKHAAELNKLNIYFLK